MKGLTDIHISQGDAGKGRGRQIDAKLEKTGEPVRILQTGAGFHVAIGKDGIKAGTPPPVNSDTLWEIIRKACGG